MKLILRISLLSLILLLPTGYAYKRLDYREAMHINVCKELKGDVLVYLIFVDNKESIPWSQFDMKSTIDSVAVAIRWLMQKGKENGISIKIKSDYFIGKDFSIIKKNLPHGTVLNTIYESGLKNGLQEINSWADYITKKAGSTFNITEKDGIPDPGKPKNKERLIAYLRDEYHVESVVLLFMLNNYYKTDLSIPVNTFSTKDVEFAVVSYKYPSEIAHNILQLYGAADLYKTPFRRNEKKIEFMAKEFPNEIMQDPYAKSINKCEISEYTKYLIGWTDKLPSQYHELLTDKSVNF
jgi:hypothetical protein